MRQGMLGSALIRIENEVLWKNFLLLFKSIFKILKDSNGN
jgi:hypothetical protein